MQIDRLTPEVRELASGLKLPEGPVALPDGSVILVEMRRQTLSRVTAAGQVEVVADLGGGPKGAIQVVDPRTGKVETLYDRCDGQPIGAPNDLVFDEAGGFWFTDFGVCRPGSTDGGGDYYARREPAPDAIPPPWRSRRRSGSRDAAGRGSRAGSCLRTRCGTGRGAAARARPCRRSRRGHPADRGT